MLRFKKVEFIKLVRLAIPIMFAQLFQAGMGFTDIIIAGHYSDGVLAAVGLGVSVWNPLMFFAVGALMSFSVLSAYYHGANSLERIPEIFRDGLYFVGAFTLIILSIICFPQPIFNLFKADADLAMATTKYLRGLAVGVPAVFLFFSVRLISEGLSRPNAALMVSAFGFFMNWLISYSLVFGIPSLGIPELGVLGAGLATGICFWLMFIAMCILICLDRRLSQVKMFSKIGRPHWPHIKEMAKIGLPNGAAIFSEVSIFSVAGLILSRFGEKVVASHQISLNLTGMTFMIPLSISFALTALVGHSMGKKDHVSAIRIGRMGISTTMLFMFVSVSFFILFRDRLPFIFTTNVEIAALSAQLLIFAALFQLPDCLQVSTFSVLRGMKDTKVPMYFCIFAYWIVAIPLSYYLGVVLGHQAKGVWIGMIIGLATAATTLGLRFILLSRSYLKSNN